MASNQTIISIFNNRVRKYRTRCALKVKLGTAYTDISWFSFGRFVRYAALALIKLGVQPGDRLAILSENRPEWAYADFGIMACGAVSVPIYATDTPRDIEYILKDSGAAYIFLSDKNQLDKILSIKKQTKLKKIIIFDKIGTPDPRVLTLKKLLDAGRVFDLGEPHLYDIRSESVREDDIVTIIYTSGSTNKPKGVMLTQKNLLSNCRSSSAAIKITDKDLYLSFLPLSHVFERMAGLYQMLIQGAVIAYAESKYTVIDNAKELSPTIICGVPRFYEKLYAGILNSAISGPAIKKNIFFWAYRVGRRCAVARAKGKRAPIPLRVQKGISTGKISKKLKAMLGGRLRFFISGGAPLSKEIAEFFLAFGILILEGYGLTETSPVISVNTEDAFKIGTVGRPVRGVGVKISSGGEILVKGPGVMKGYYRQYEDTENTIKDGWLHTGDIGHIDEDGYLVITDRKKDIIVTSGGKNVAPLEIETILKADRYLGDCMLYGDRRKYITAIVVPDFKKLAEYADYKKIPYTNMTELIKNEKVKQFISRRIARRQKDLPGFAQIKDFIILDKELTQDRGELTPTLKIKRRVVTAEYKDLLDSLYEKTD